VAATTMRDTAAADTVRAGFVWSPWFGYGIGDASIQGYILLPHIPPGIVIQVPDIPL